MTGSQDAARADAAVAAVEQQMSALFNRVRSSWKDQAVAVHPDLQPVGFKILAQLVRGGPSHAGVLADLLQTDKSIVSRQVRIMEGLGLVESREDPADGRARVLAATPLALEKVNGVRTDNQVRLGQLLRSWPTEDVEKFAELISRLTT